MPGKRLAGASPVWCIEGHMAAHGHSTAGLEPGRHRLAGHGHEVGPRTVPRWCRPPLLRQRRRHSRASGSAGDVGSPDQPALRVCKAAWAKASRAPLNGEAHPVVVEVLAAVVRPALAARPCRMAGSGRTRACRWCLCRVQSIPKAASLNSVSASMTGRKHRRLHSRSSPPVSHERGTWPGWRSGSCT